jgi:flagellar M-ring protein FliF
VNPRLAALLAKARSMLAGFTPGQRAIVVVAVLALGLGAFALSKFAAQPNWTPLFTNLSGSDANAVVEQLTADNVQYQLADGGQTILVPQPQVYNLRVALSGKGVPAGDSDSGYALLDKQGLTATDFQQNVAYRRALEGELNKTLQAFDGVNTAVVHLAMPKKDVFTTEQDKVTASVLLALKPGEELDRGQVKAATRLVAGAVEGLDPDNVTITDSEGHLLSTPSTGAAGSADAMSDADAQTAKYEDRITAAAQGMLDKVLGAGRAVVRVNAQLNFDQTDRTSETYVAPNALPPLSESSSSESYTGAGSGSGGTVGQTWPTLTPGTPDSGSGGAYNKTNKTVNNPVGKVVERNQQAPGRIERLTVAVVLDAKSAGTVNPAQVQALVGNAVGLDTTRGDSVQVDAVPFDTSAQQDARNDLAQANQQAAIQQYIGIGKQAGLVLLILIVLFILWRSTRRKTTKIDVTAANLPQEGVLVNTVPAGLEGSPALAALESGDGTAALSGGDGLEGEDLREEVAGLVDNSPDEIALLLQSWLAEQKA